MNLTKLEQYFQEILDADIKAIPQKVTTLFDIAGFPHRETVMSNFYAYYFDPNEQHQLGDLFISALSEIIKSKKNGLSVLTNFGNCKIEREVFTNNGKFIDIVITESSDNNNEAENAIIIENKIYAAVYNDLREYYNFVKVNKNKAGVVLSLVPEQNLHEILISNTHEETFINITHDELLSQVEQSSGSYFLNADIKQIIILKEFIQNIKSMTQTNDLNEQYEFFFKNQKKIKEISELYSTIKADMFRQVDEVCDKLNLGLTLQSKSNSQYRIFYSKSAPVYFAVWLENYFNKNKDGKVYISVQLNGKGIESINKINEIQFDEKEKEIMKKLETTRKVYFICAEIFDEPKLEDLKDFTNYVYKIITETPIKSIFTKIEKLLENRV